MFSFGAWEIVSPDGEGITGAGGVVVSCGAGVEYFAITASRVLTFFVVSVWPDVAGAWRAELSTIAEVVDAGAEYFAATARRTGFVFVEEGAGDDDGVPAYLLSTACLKGFVAINFYVTGRLLPILG